MTLRQIPGPIAHGQSLHSPSYLVDPVPVSGAGSANHFVIAFITRTSKASTKLPGRKESGPRISRISYPQKGPYLARASACGSSTCGLAATARADPHSEPSQAGTSFFCSPSSRLSTSWPRLCIYQYSNQSSFAFAHRASISARRGSAMKEMAGISSTFDIFLMYLAENTTRRKSKSVARP